MKGNVHYPLVRVSLHQTQDDAVADIFQMLDAGNSSTAKFFFESVFDKDAALGEKYS